MKLTKEQLDDFVAKLLLPWDGVYLSGDEHRVTAQSGDFSVGDVVTRDGSDLHLVTYLTEDGFSGDFLCIRAPATGWIEVGETESNLARRYSFVRLLGQSLEEIAK